jgi:hypothetical protein
MLEKADFNPERFGQKIPYLGGKPVEGTYLEMIYDQKEAKTGFALWDGQGVKYIDRFPINGNRFLSPYSPNNNLIIHRVVLFPSKAQEYGSEEELIREIQAFIHKYVDVSPIFEKIAVYYVLLTWIYDSFNELPYLRLRGDFGTGKTRFLLIIGSICYRPIFASGASTVSPVFRILDSFRGTLIIDEGDFRMSDEKAEIIKILNNGNARGFPVLRSEVTGNRKEFNPTAFNVFGPKIVGTRGYFQDRALESRFISEEMGRSKLREDIPINLPSIVDEEALGIRNKLLLFRFRNLDRRIADASLIDRALEPRLNQIFIPLLSIIWNEAVKGEILNLAREYSREMVTERGMETEAKILAIISEMLDSPDREISVKNIASRFAEKHGEDFIRKITPHWIGRIIRKKLGIRTQKQKEGYLIEISEKPKLDRLFQRYGIARSDELGELCELPGTGIQPEETEKPS